MNKNTLQKYETIWGASAGVIPTVLFAIIKPETMIPFWYLLVTVIIFMFYIWYDKVSHVHKLKEMENKYVASKNEDDEKIKAADAQIKTLHKRMEELQYKEMEHRNFKLNVIDVDWEHHKMKFVCNIECNILTKGQCLTVSQEKDGYIYPFGIARLVNFDYQQKNFIANFLTLSLYDDFELDCRPTKETLRISPVLEYEILNAVLKYNNSFDEDLT